MLGCVPAICPDETVSMWLFANFLHRGGNGVHHVVVKRSTRKRKPTSLCELLVQAETKRLGAKLHCRREARVQVNEVVFIRWLAGELV